MVKKCKEENCNTWPNFNLPNKKIGIYCSKHKKVDMVDVKHKKCLQENCNKNANFNLQNEKVGIYCVKHKKENMVNVVNKKCVEQNCNKQPVFNLLNEKVGIYCHEHKKENMVDVKNKKCVEENCNKISSYNLLNEKSPIYCSEHKKENMVNVISNRCLELNCNKIPSCNLPNKKSPIYCSENKKDNMINVKNKRCLEENCDMIPSNKKYKGYCLRCFINLFPNEKISKNYKVKENHMTDFIKEQFKDEIIIFDKQTGGCSKRRPDCYIDKYTHVIIIECDENQHKNEEYTICDNKRTMELFQDFGNRPIVFIRFNPDKYINGKEENFSSSFKMHKSLDIPVIRNKNEWNNRLKLLQEYINKWLINDIVPNKEITIEYLFYDYTIK